MASVAQARASYGRLFDRRGSGQPAGSPDRLTRLLALSAFTILAFSTIALNAFKIGGVPLRSIAAVGLLGITSLFYFDLIMAVVRRHALLFVLTAALAILGTAISYVNGAPVGEILFAVSEVHLQAAVLFLLAAVFAHLAGARACSLAFVAVVGLSALFALAQMVDLHAAWAVRRALGPLPNEAIEGASFIDRRPSGLSYSPIQLSTHLCLAFACFLAVRDRLRQKAGLGRRADPAVLPVLAALFGACIATATRSPILGGMVFLTVYSLQRRTSWLPLFLILIGVLIYIAWPLLMGVVETYAPRVARTDDDSASARYTLAYYGVRLFLDNPLGYGLTFEPWTHWSRYWPDLYTMPAPQGVQIRDLHNYVLTLLNIYGISLLLVAPIGWMLLRRAGVSVIFFIPYIVHVLFHNSGPFANDTVIWFVIAAIAAVKPIGAAQPTGTIAPVSGLKSNNLQRLHPSARQLLVNRRAVRPR